MPVVVALIASVALASLAIYQILLLVGLPLARFAWGGEDHYLQPPHRPFAILAILIALSGIFAAVQGANLFLVIPVLASQLACYAYSVLFFAAFVVTARSRSLTERRIMLPFYVILSALFLIVALAGHAPSSGFEIS